MPNYTRGQLRDQARFVLINPVLAYGWNTKDLAAAVGISDTDLSTQLGHMTATQADAVSGRIMVGGANSPKPARVVKRDPTAPISQAGSTNTFIAYNKMAAALAAGWRPAQKGRGVKLTAAIDGRRSQTAIATLSNGVLYCFPMNRADFAEHGAALGLESAATITTATERRKLVTGTRTKPGRASQPSATGTFSSFYSTASADDLVTSGYDIDSEEFIEYGAASGGGGGT